MRFRFRSDDVPNRARRVRRIFLFLPRWTTRDDETELRWLEFATISEVYVCHAGEGSAWEFDGFADDKPGEYADIAQM